MKDIVVGGHLKSFVDSFGFQGLKEYEQFERFCFYSLLNNEVSRTLNKNDIEAMSVGDNQGIDGIAFIINGEIITTLEELTEILDSQIKMNVSLYFFQAKTSASFDDNDTRNFLDIVTDFLKDTPTYVLTTEAKDYHEMYLALLNKISLVRPFNLFAMYCSIGEWNPNTTISTTISDKQGVIEDLSVFDKVEITPIDRKNIIKHYKNASNPTEARFRFSKKIALEDIEGVDEAYIGLVPFSEFKNLIIDTDGVKLRNLFYDNVRDFLGLDNKVNEKIYETLTKGNFSEFALLNNGVTVIASENKGKGERFVLQNYQIVNGCQTSNVLYECRNQPKIDNVIIPIKVIFTKDETLRDQIIFSTNNQSRIEADDLLALTDFQKDLEAYYASAPEDILYERRDNQYANRPDVKKKSIVEIREQIKSFVGMFLDEPHVVSGYYGRVYRERKGEIFAKNHLYEPYYISGLIQYLFKEFLNSKDIERKYNKARYHVFMLFRMLNESEPFEKDFLKASKRKKAYFDNLLLILRDKDKCLESLNRTFKIIDDSGIDIQIQKEIYKKSTTNALIDTFHKTYV